MNINQDLIVFILLFNCVMQTAIAFALLLSFRAMPRKVSRFFYMVMPLVSAWLVIKGSKSNENK